MRSGCRSFNKRISNISYAYPYAADEVEEKINTLIGLPESLIKKFIIIYRIPVNIIIRSNWTLQIPMPQEYVKRILTSINFHLFKISSKF